MGAVSRVRVLLVGCAPSVAHLVRDTLARATGGPYELAHVHRLAEALAYLTRSATDVVLLDSPLPDAGGIESLHKLLGAVRGLRVVMLARPADAPLAQDALKRGACGYLVKDSLWELDAPLLVRAIEAARRNAQVKLRPDAPAARPAPKPRREARVLSFLGARGGAGTTSLALDAALIAHGRGHTVALVELGAAAGGLPALTGIDPKRHHGQLFAPGAELDTAAVDRALTDLKPGLRILFAPRGARRTELDPEAVGVLLDCLGAMFDLVVLDLPRDGSLATRAAAERSRFVTVVVDSDAACIRQAADCVTVLHGWSINAARVGLVVVNRPRSMDVPITQLAKRVAAEVVGVVPVPPGRPLAPVADPEAPVDGQSDAFTLSLVNLTERLLGADVVPIRAPAAAVEDTAA
jgi:DNA-binding NarL/FixJ family response regulator/MinD-like ATPase involved in chromosome partitioning or flagellar assembly